MSQAHDYGEAEENDIRRDDHLEREFGVTGRDFQRGSDRDNQEYDLRRRMAEESFRRDSELFDARMSERNKLADLEARRRERAEVSSDDRDGLRFRDAAIHSTAVGSLEAETASVGDEMMENTVDEEHPMGADAKGGVA